jgi:hypothetical protein
MEKKATKAQKANKRLRQHNSIEGIAFRQGWDASSELGFCRDFILSDSKRGDAFIRFLRNKAKKENEI